MWLQSYFMDKACIAALFVSMFKDTPIALHDIFSLSTTFSIFMQSSGKVCNEPGFSIILCLSDIIAGGM